MKPKPKSTTSKSRLQLLHQYYIYTGFYAFVWQSVKAVLPYIMAFVIGAYIIDYFFDINTLLSLVTDTLPDYGVLLFFLVSETLLGLIPPEIFIAWAGSIATPWLYLSILASLSYIGGLLSYWIGHAITTTPKVHQYLEVKMAQQLKNARKWGGFLIIVGALLPLPFSISCLAAGIIEFPFKNVMLYGTLRFLRFLVYGMIIFHVF